MLEYLLEKELLNLLFREILRHSQNYLPYLDDLLVCPTLACFFWLLLLLLRTLLIDVD